MKRAKHSCQPSYHILVQIKFWQVVCQLKAHCRMAQCKDTILKMEQSSTNSNVIKGSVSTGLLSFSVSAQNQAMSQKVSVVSHV